MKVCDDGTEDRFGRHPIVFKQAKVDEIHTWLFNHYQGYKFAIVFDETKEEYEEFKDTYVYFLDEILDEAAGYADKAVVAADRIERGTGNA